MCFKLWFFQKLSQCQISWKCWHVQQKITFTHWKPGNKTNQPLFSSVLPQMGHSLDGKAQPLLYIYIFIYLFTHLQKCGCKIVFQNCMTMCGVFVSLCFCVCVRGSGCQIPGFIAYIPVSIYYIPVFIDIHWLYPNIRGFYLGFNVDWFHQNIL